MRTIQIIAKKKINRETKEEFLSFYWYCEKQKRKVFVNFPKEYKDTPTKSGTITYLEENAHIDNRGLVPVLYINKIESFEPYSEDMSKYFD